MLLRPQHPSGIRLNKTMTEKTKTLLAIAVAVVIAVVLVVFFTRRNIQNAPVPEPEETVVAEEAEPVPEDPNSINGHKWVDLGSGIKWATTNIGANSPEEFGDYFAWGETAPKEAYDWNNYSHRRPGKDNNELPEEWDGRDLNSYEEFDAARQLWGGTWRMPKSTEIRQLIRACTSEWTELNGIPGYRLVSKTTGEEIFFPAAGHLDGTKNNGTGTHGYYWAADGFDFMSGYNLYFKYTKASKRLELGYFDCPCGFPIRPVSD